MFTARQFLESPAELGKYRELPKQLRGDIERLRREFLAIATDPNESLGFRSTSLMVLFHNSEELAACGSEDVTGGLMTAFKMEFSTERLAQIAASMRDWDCPPDGFLLHLFAVTLAKLAPDASRDLVAAAETTLKGTCLEETLTRRLQRVRQNNTDNSSGSS